MDSASILKWLEAVIPPVVFLLVLWALLEPRYSRRATIGTAVGFLTAELAVQALVLLLGDSAELALTLLPLTLYLPAILCLHLLSKSRFFPTALTWLFALLCDYLLEALQKLLQHLPASFLNGLSQTARAWFLGGLQALGAVLLLALVYLAIRRPFLAYVGVVERNWPSLLFLPVMLLALYSYFLSSTIDVGALLLLFLTALAAFWALSRLIASLGSERHTREVRLQMEALRQDYELLQKKLELGRSSRHDMRHHMTALSALLQEGNYDEARRYMADWQGQLTQLETETWCRNAAVNAVLSAYLAQAREAGCTSEVNVSLPKEFPFEEVDLCVVLANALENAIHACGAAPEGAPRQIKLSVSLADRRRLTILVENSCYQSVEFDGDGFPIVPRREGHGQGLRSIAAAAEKYHGLFQCDCKDGIFTLRVVLLDGSPEPKESHRGRAVCAGIFLGLFLINCLPNLAQALELIPVLGPLVRVVDLRTYALYWGDSGITVQDPELEGDGQVVDELTAQKEEFIRRMQETFIWYASRKYQGYVAEDITYDVMRSDEELFILRFNATLNAGGSVDYSRYIVLDQRTGQVLSLADLFEPEANYLFPISREIKAQMAEQMKAGEGSYFLPGGIWSDEECFQSIQPDQNFYVNDSGQLVIVFAEYEVAPGSMGTPEFVIPTDVLNGLLVQPSILQ